MAKKTTKKNPPKEKGKVTFMFPLLHQDIMDTVSDEIGSPWFHEDDTDNGISYCHQTHVMGRFRCFNRACSNGGWGSRMVAILIRGYPRNGYNAVVFNQRCKLCNKLGKFTLDENSYIDRVAYRLKKWGGVQMKYERRFGNGGPPHESSLCEGCKRNVCQQANNRKHD